MCEFVPQNWLFYVDGGCCISGTQPFNIAEWIGDMCNEEWREPFKVYGGMAKEDWEEWIEPWNWTVRAENTTSRTVKPSTCSSPSSNLAAFAVENISILLLGFFESFIKYRQAIRYERRQVRYHRPFYPGRATLTWRRTTRGKLGELAEIRWVTWGLVSAAVQIAANFVTAYITKRTPGYDHVPFVQLALLYGARPRISWLACALTLIPPTKIGIINAEHFGNAAATFALSEVILQAFGSVYLGITANMGRERGFYYVNHLQPFWRGRDAFRMYIGALFWLLGCGFVFVGWIVHVFVMARFLRSLGRAKQWINDALEQHSIHPSRQSTYPHGEHQRRRQQQPLLPPENVGDTEITRHSTLVALISRYEDKDQDMRRISILFVLAAGMFAFIAQWLFWDGFVKSSGPR
ncbi:hypothetical protein MMC24_001434 [Lignoscripta atroalba]|nr:hypothetical protein [Lignoscripta atroalba]